MKPFAIYRLPGEHFATRISASKIAVPTDCCDLNSRSGFVIAPFIPSSQSPLLLIEPEDVVEPVTNVPRIPQIGANNGKIDPVRSASKVAMAVVIPL